MLLLLPQPVLSWLLARVITGAAFPFFFIFFLRFRRPSPNALPFVPEFFFGFRRPSPASLQFIFELFFFFGRHVRVLFPPAPPFFPELLTLFGRHSGIHHETVPLFFEMFFRFPEFCFGFGRPSPAAFPFFFVHL